MLICINYYVGNPVNRATPMTPEILMAMRAIVQAKPSLTKWQTVWRAYMEFVLLLR